MGYSVDTDDYIDVSAGESDSRCDIKDKPYCLRCWFIFLGILASVVVGAYFIYQSIYAFNYYDLIRIIICIASVILFISAYKRVLNKCSGCI